MLIAESEKLKRQHEAGSKESRAKTRDEYKKIPLSKKDLHALIDERIGSKKARVSPLLLSRILRSILRNTRTRLSLTVTLLIPTEK